LVHRVGGADGVKLNLPNPGTRKKKQATISHGVKRTDYHENEEGDGGERFLLPSLLLPEGGRRPSFRGKKVDQKKCLLRGDEGTSLSLTRDSSR